MTTRSRPVRPDADAWKPAVRVLNALTQAAPGALAALTSAALLPSRSRTPKPPPVWPNWLVVSITILPASASAPPAWARAVSTAAQGTGLTTPPAGPRRTFGAAVAALHERTFRGLMP